MEKLEDMNVLYDGFIKMMKSSSRKEEALKFEVDFLSGIANLKQEIKKQTYEPSQGHEFTLKERGKTRHVHGPNTRDKVVQNSLCDAVLDKALHPYLIYNNSASQKGKGVDFARRKFERDLHNYWLKYRTNDGYVGFVDLSKFYDNIQHKKLKEMVSPKVDELSNWLFGKIVDTFKVDVSYMSDEEYAGCMSRIFDSVKYYNEIPEALRTGQKYMEKSMNIGARVSQDGGIFYPARIDNYAKIVRGVKGYGRYMDDIYIIGCTKEYVESVIRGIADEANELGLFVNKKKTHIAKLTDTYKYLQVRYTLTETGKVIKRINPKAVTRERRKLKAYKRLYDKKEMGYDDIEQAYKSWMGAHVQIMSKDQIKHMKQLYKDLFGKEPRWKKQK